MKFKVVSGNVLKEAGPTILVKGADPEDPGSEDLKYYDLHSGSDGILLGICSKPGMPSPAANKEVTIHCQQFVDVVKVNKLAVVNICEKKMSESKLAGYEFLVPHYSLMAPLNLKFNCQLSVDGSINKLWFYLKVE